MDMVTAPTCRYRAPKTWDDPCVSAAPVPFNRWGLIVEPEDSAGAYLLVEPEKPDGWKVPKVVRVRVTLEHRP